MVGKAMNCLAGLVLLSLAIANTHSATVNRQPALNTGGNRRIMNPAFQNAGKAPGMEIWRVENFKAVPYPKSDYGKFYTGDSYIVLNTKVARDGSFTWDIHFWLGRETSQDEAGSAAALTVQLDDQFGGVPVQYREVQEHESQLFLSYFKNGVLRYVPGGVASGFTHVDRNSFEKRLFHVKGKRNIRVKQVDVALSSMNKGDCFILDLGNDIYVYQGKDSKRTERLKSITAANQIRDQDHGGRSKITVIDEFSSESEIQKFFSVMGGYSQADIPDQSAGGDDEQFENTEERSVTLYKVSDVSGTLKVEPVSQKPLKQNMLDTNDCFILDTAGSNIFVWVGKKCSPKEKTESMTKAQAFLTTKKYPAWTQVQRIVEGGEPSSFQQYFQTWRSASELHPRLIRSADKPPTRLEMKSEGEAPEFMPDDGTGDVEIFRIENLEPQGIPSGTEGKFFGGDSYIVRYNKNNKWIIYIWQGKDSSNDEKAASALQAINMDNELGGKAIQIRVEQDSESKHFLHIFKGKMIVFLGGHASGFKNIQDHDTYVRGSTRMYRVRGTNEFNVRATQVIPEAKSLSSDDVFIVENDNNAWMWAGKDSHEFERSLVAGFAKILIPNGPIPQNVQEGNEPQEFWTVLGGKTSYPSSFDSDVPALNDPVLLHCTLKNDKWKFEEILNYSQDDLVEDDVMMLDTGSTVYVWVGKGCDEDEKAASFRVAKDYLLKKGRSSVTIHVKQGKEPNAFKLLFPTWNVKMWETTESYNDIRAKFQ